MADMLLCTCVKNRRCSKNWTQSLIISVLKYGNISLGHEFHTENLKYRRLLKTVEHDDDKLIWDVLATIDS